MRTYQASGTNYDYTNAHSNTGLSAMPSTQFLKQLATITCLVLSAPLVADIYSWTDADGTRIYSDQKPSETAQPTASTPAINYYTASKIKPDPAYESPTGNEQLSTLTALSEAEDETELNEQQCQQQYSRSCDEIINWQDYASQACGDDPRCQDSEFLERKYRPRSNEELREIALRAAIRNNNHDDKIALFLTKKYTNYCENQAAMLCSNKLSKNCRATMQHYCEDPRDLNDIFRRYDNLTTLEKQAIINKAKTLATANGQNALNYDKMLASLLEILISQAMLGI